MDHKGYEKYLKYLKNRDYTFEFEDRDIELISSQVKDLDVSEYNPNGWIKNKIVNGLDWNTLMDKPEFRKIIAYQGMGLETFINEGSQEVRNIKRDLVRTVYSV